MKPRPVDRGLYTISDDNYTCNEILITNRI